MLMAHILGARSAAALIRASALAATLFFGAASCRAGSCPLMVPAVLPHLVSAA